MLWLRLFLDSLMRFNFDWSFLFVNLYKKNVAVLSLCVSSDHIIWHAVYPINAIM